MLFEVDLSKSSFRCLKQILVLQVAHMEYNHLLSLFATPHFYINAVDISHFRWGFFDWKRVFILKIHVSEKGMKQLNENHNPKASPKRYFYGLFPWTESGVFDQRNQPVFSSDLPYHRWDSYLPLLKWTFPQVESHHQRNIFWTFQESSSILREESSWLLLSWTGFR